MSAEMSDKEFREKFPFAASIADIAASKKGMKDGNCNREACQKPGATWYNRGSYRYYCAACAKAINSYCARDEEPLCRDTENS